jgi:phosphoglycolate phosphatase-like HAD superfamily hydrolase
MRNTKLKAKGILFDLDGTIVDSRQAYIAALKAAFLAVGQKIVDIEVATEIPKRLEQNLPLNDLLQGIDVQKFLNVYLTTWYQATATKTKPIPGIFEALEKLSRKAELALITRRNVSKQDVIHELQKLDLAKYFQHIITAQDKCNPKPSPEALIECAEKLGLQASECIVVGDSVADVRAGKNAGAKTVAVLSGIFSRKELEKEKPDLILENVNQLPDFLE